MAYTVLDPAAAPNTPARWSTPPQATTQRPWPGNAQVPPARGRHLVARDPAQRHELGRRQRLTLFLTQQQLAGERGEHWT